jgi:hypothetical protein
MIFNEETSFSLNVKPRDDSGAAVTPTTARYKISCLTTGRSIRSYTTLTASSEMTIAITPDDNVIVTDGNRLERRQVQVQTEYDTDNQNVFVYEYDIRNLA